MTSQLQKCRIKRSSGNSYWGPTIFDANFIQNSGVNDDLPFVSSSASIIETNIAYVKNMRTTSSDGLYSTGSIIDIIINFTLDVNVDTTSGTPYITLNANSATASYTGGSGTSALTFRYTVRDGDYSSDLDYSVSSITLNGATIEDTPSGDPANLNLPTISSKDNLAGLHNIQVDSETPTVTLSSSDSDNIINLTQTVSITATFSKDMQSTPTITIPSVGTFDMSLTTASTTWYYDWDTTGVSTGTYAISVNGTATNGRSYVGTDTLSLDIQKRIYLDTNGITIKCPTANVSETAVIGGKEYVVVDEASLRTRANNADDLTCVCTSQVTDTSSLFYNKTSFNQDISSWDTSNVTNMRELFRNATSFNQIFQMGYKKCVKHDSFLWCFLI